MENASKALIIAGAILISILLISVGVLIMNSTGDTQASVEDSAATIAKRTFNSNFTPFEGPGQSAAQIRTLISTVKSSNASNDAENSVSIVGKDGTTFSAKTLKSSKKYTVDLDYSDKTGYVNKITISETTESDT